MDALLLSRIQFGLSVGFHYIFPAATLGLSLFLLILESLFLWTKRDIYRDISTFYVRLLSLVFGLGVATGLLLPFSFGTNWSRFSVFSSNIFGAQLAIEAITAFSVESVAMAILVFGRDRVTKPIYWLSAAMVFLASHMSGFWIVSANSWMQTPAGYALRDGSVILTDFRVAIWNPSTLMRFLHTIIGGWITGAVIACAISAYYLLKQRHVEFARKSMLIGMVLLAITPLLELGIGHVQILGVSEHQPIKNAAYEGIFQTRDNAPLYLFGVPDIERESIRFGLYIPKLLSFLEGWSFDTPIRGLREFPRSLWPPVGVIFITFHAMVAIGMILIGSGLTGAFLLATGRLERCRWFLRILIALVPLPFLANELGWVGAEIGRQPWVVYGLLRTDQAASSLATYQVLATLSALAIVYALLFVAFVFFSGRMIRGGPAAHNLAEDPATETHAQTLTR